MPEKSQSDPREIPPDLKAITQLVPRLQERPEVCSFAWR